MCSLSFLWMFLGLYVGDTMIYICDKAKFVQMCGETRTKVQCLISEINMEGKCWWWVREVIWAELSSLRTRRLWCSQEFCNRPKHEWVWLFQMWKKCKKKKKIASKCYTLIFASPPVHLTLTRFVRHISKTVLQKTKKSKKKKLKKNVQRRHETTWW